MIKTVYFLFLFLLVSCGISEDCLKGNGESVQLTFPYDNFTKVKVYSGVGLVIKEGTEYNVTVKTTSSIKDDISVSLQGDMLQVKDNSTCNIARDYGETTVYITAPNLEEIHSKTEQDIKTDGVLHYNVLRLFSMEDADGTGTGDFYINLDTLGHLVVENNTIANYYITGNAPSMLLNFYFGNGRFYGENFNVHTIKLFHRGSNDMILYPEQRVEGQLVATGNVILKNNPPEMELEQLFSGEIIYD